MWLPEFTACGAAAVAGAVEIQVQGPFDSSFVNGDVSFDSAIKDTSVEHTKDKVQRSVRRYSVFSD